MFDYFEGNYTWNMAVNIALGMGASIGDIDGVSKALRPYAKQNDDAAAELWFTAWNGLGAKIRKLAQDDEAKGRKFSAGEKYRRAAIHFVQAERMQRPGFAPRVQAFADYLDCYAKFVALTKRNSTRVEIPYKGRDNGLPGLFVAAQGLMPGERAPCMVHFDGLDVTKEIIDLLGVAEALARRGVSTLIVDNPGVGESLRLRGLHNGPDAEVPAGACIDFLEKRDDVDPKRIGIMALSLGGFHAPRVAAFEPRVACAVAWGAQYDWGDTQRMRASNKNASLPVPHYWDHVAWVFGVEGMPAILEASGKISLHGILDRITCPIIVIHGENDRQIPLAYAERVVKECVNAKRAELLVMKLADGGAEHCGIDNVALTREVMSDWIAEALGGRTG
jgi:dienelactone hydrolase